MLPKPVGNVTNRLLAKNMTDPISDMLTRIRNAYRAGHKTVVIPHSHTKEKIVKILVQEGYLHSFSVKNSAAQPLIYVELRYHGKLPALDGLKRISKPGRRIYVRNDKLPKTLGGAGITLVSTSKGIITDKQARKDKLGGEVICQVW